MKIYAIPFILCLLSRIPSMLANFETLRAKKTKLPFPILPFSVV